MTFLRNLWRDLVDKKLWPVAVALVLAAVAVPVLIPIGSSDKTGVVPPPAAAAPATDGGEITVAVAHDDREHARSGKARDPFKPEVFAKVPKTATATATGTGGTTASGSTSSSGTPATTPAATTTHSSPAASGSSTSTSSGSGATSGPAAPSSTPSAPAVKRKWFANTITLQLKRAGKKTKRAGVKAITYLPSPSYPLLAFLGNTANGRRATFAVMDGVVVTGPDRVCRPSRTRCEIVELGLDDELLFTKPPADPSKAKHYRLTIRRIGMTEVAKPLTSTGTKASARAAGSAKAPAVTLAPAGTSGR